MFTQNTMGHLEVIAEAGLIAFTALLVVPSVVCGLVYYFTREKTTHATVVEPKATTVRDHLTAGVATPAAA